MSLERAAWYEVRRAQNSKPATYRCPFCGRHLLAMTEHVLVKPEGRSEGRRHAHTECALRARRAGRLPGPPPPPPGALRRALARLRDRSG